MEQKKVALNNKNSNLIKLCQLFILVIIFMSSIPSFAQHSIKGRIIDENNEPLTYAHVVLLNPADSTLKYFDVADDNGVFHIKHIKPGDYLMQYSFVTKETIYEAVTLPLKSGDDVGDKVMKSTLTDEVVVTAEYVPIQVKSDTMEFNAKAFETKPDAVVEDLLKKIPGLEVDQSGNVKALGEDVKKVLVDGKEFFGKDTKVATKNLPAKAVEKVQVYDKKSEEAEFMGIDDGVRDRTINLLLNKEHKKGYFGRVEAGAGTDDFYKSGGKIYRFSSKLQSAYLGNVNNINEFGYSKEDHKEFGKKINGLNTTGAGGVNLSYNATEYNRYFASYLGSSTKKDLRQNTVTQNFLEKGSYEQKQNLAEDARTTPHKVNFGVRHNFNKQHNLTVDGDININSGKTESQRYTNTEIETVPINNLDQLIHSTSELVDAETKAVYIAKLNSDKTQVKTNVFALYNKNKSGLNWRDRITFANPDSVGIYYQSQDNLTDRNTLYVSPTLVQQLPKLWYLSAGVDLVATNNNLTRDQEILEQDGDLISPVNPDFSTTERVVKPTLSFRRNTSKHQYDFVLGTSWNQFDKVMGDHSIGTKNYFYLLPGFTYENNYRKGSRINFRYNSSVNMPTVQQLYPVEDNINLLSIYRGNTDLTPEVRHNAVLSWWLFDYFSFTSLFTHVSAGYTKNKISWSQSTDRDLIKITEPVNTPYFYTASSYIAFSTPIRAFGIKVNITSHENWSKGLTYINSRENIQTNFIHMFGLNFDYRKKGIWDAKIGGSLSVTDSRFSVTSNNSIYFNTNYYSGVRFTPNKKWNLQVDANVVNFDAQSFDETVSIPIINARIDYYFSRGGKASLTLRGVDLLNKNIGFRRFSADNYLMQEEWNTIGRYVMLSLNMRIGK